MNLRRLFIPSRHRQIEALEIWEVRWSSSHGHGDCIYENRPECEVFTNSKAAYDFADTLRAAFRLLNITHKNHVRVEHKGSN